MAKYKSKLTGQEGVASIFVVMVLMSVMGLISVGFSFLMNREVRQALDRQLSAEAYYAAESGVNDARDYIAANGVSFPGCAAPLAGGHFIDVTSSGGISGDGISRYSCININTTPKELIYTIDPGQSIVIKLSGADLQDLSKLYFGWENAASYISAPQPLGSCPVIGGKLRCQTPQESVLAQDQTGLLRVGIYPVVSSCDAVDDHGNRFSRYSSATNTSDAILECASRNYFLYPNAATGASNAVDYGCNKPLLPPPGCPNPIDATNDGSFVRGECQTAGVIPSTNFNQTTSRYCYSAVTNLIPVRSGAGFAQSYYLRLTAVYKSLNVSILGVDASVSPEAALSIADAEAIVDVTGVGNDVLRRIQARIPLQNNISFSYGLQSMMSVCKLFRNPVPLPGEYDSALRDFGSFNSDGSCDTPLGDARIGPGGLPPIIEPPPPPPPPYGPPPYGPPPYGPPPYGPPPYPPPYEFLGLHCHAGVRPTWWEHWGYPPADVREERNTGVGCTPLE